MIKIPSIKRKKKYKKDLFAKQNLKIIILPPLSKNN
jgi:hypothetical protein